MDGSKLGSLITDGDRRRDAVHVAVVPVTSVSGLPLRPGMHVRFEPEGQHETVVGWMGRDDLSIGIVDPFLRESVNPGERFWMFLYPNTVTSLRHVWTHPAFTAVPPPAPKPDPYPE